MYDSFRKCENRKNELTPSGAGFTKEPSCKFYKELMFLKNVVSGRSTTSNLPALPFHSSPTSTGNGEGDLSQQPGCSLQRKQRKRKQSGNMSLDDFEASVVSALKVPVGDKDEDELFWLSLTQQLKRLSRKQNCLAKMKIQKVLFDAEFANDDE